LTIVIDHLGKPPLGSDEMERWEELLRAAAELPNVHAKVSGLNTAMADRHWTADDLQPAVVIALDAFGVERLVLGSDWPVCLLNGTYKRVQQETLLAVKRACDEPRPILEENAERIYRLADAEVPFIEERA
jgi:L-fuconolactonase